METIFFSLFFLNCVLFFVFCHGIESPQFTPIHSESDFEIRLYKESSWISAPVQGVSFEKAIKEGFHRLYQYIHGDNANSTQLAMTAPILTSFIPQVQPPLYAVRFYLSKKLQQGAPHPLPDLNLQIGKWGTRCVVIRKFSGFVRDDNIAEEVAGLISSLGRSNSTKILEDKYAYTIAQYNSSSHQVGRVNEVWMDVAENAREGCEFNEGKKEKKNCSSKKSRATIGDRYLHIQTVVLSEHHK